MMVAGHLSTRAQQALGVHPHRPPIRQEDPLLLCKASALAFSTRLLAVMMADRLLAMRAFSVQGDSEEAVEIGKVSLE